MQYVLLLKWKKTNILCKQSVYDKDSRFLSFCTMILLNFLHQSFALLVYDWNVWPISISLRISSYGVLFWSVQKCRKHKFYICTFFFTDTRLLYLLINSWHFDVYISTLWFNFVKSSIRHFKTTKCQKVEHINFEPTTVSLDAKL